MNNQFNNFVQNKQKKLSQTITMRKNSEDLQKQQKKQCFIALKNFQKQIVAGKGGFGKVWKVIHTKNNNIYALKQMIKAKIINKKSVNSVMNQRRLLSTLNHPFIVNMNFAFQDRQNLYLIMDYLQGGDLRYHMCKRRRFTQNQTKFFISCIILGIQYIHSKKILHRDLKPQNLVFDYDGYLRITDFGVSREARENNQSQTSGTPGYMAPQVMCRKNHSFPVDYYALGVIAYQLMIGKRPYVGKNRKQIRDNMLSKQASIKLDEMPRGWSIDSLDFINRLIQRNPSQRLGTNGIEELKRHKWLKDVDFVSLSKKQHRSPYIPKNIQDNYQQFKRQISQDTIIQNGEQTNLMLRDKSIQQLFQGYQYKKEQNRKQESTYKLNLKSIK